MTLIIDLAKLLSAPTAAEIEPYKSDIQQSIEAIVKTYGERYAANSVRTRCHHLKHALQQFGNSMELIQLYQQRQDIMDKEIARLQKFSESQRFAQDASPLQRINDAIEPYLADLGSPGLMDASPQQYSPGVVRQFDGKNFSKSQKQNYQKQYNNQGFSQTQPLKGSGNGDMLNSANFQLSQVQEQLQQANLQYTEQIYQLSDQIQKLESDNQALSSSYQKSVRKIDQSSKQQQMLNQQNLQLNSQMQNTSHYLKTSYQVLNFLSKANYPQQITHKMEKLQQKLRSVDQTSIKVATCFQQQLQQLANMRQTQSEYRSLIVQMGGKVPESKLLYFDKIKSQSQCLVGQLGDTKRYLRDSVYQLFDPNLQVISALEGRIKVIILRYQNAEAKMKQVVKTLQQSIQRRLAGVVQKENDFEKRIKENQCFIDEQVRKQIQEMNKQSDLQRQEFAVEQRTAVSKYEQQIQQLRNQIESNQTENSNKSQEIAQLKQQVVSLNRQIDELNALNMKLQNQYGDTNQQLQSILLKQQLGATQQQSEVEVLKEQLDKQIELARLKVDRVEKVDQELVEMQHEMKKYQTHEQQLTQQISDLQQYVELNKQKQKTIENMLQEINALNIQNEKISQEKQQTIEEFQELSASVAVKEKSIQNLTSSFEELGNNIKDKEQTIQQLQSELCSLHHQFDSIKDKPEILEQLQSQHEQVVEKCQENLQKVQALTYQLQEKEQQIVSIQSQNTELTQQSENQTQQLNEQMKIIEEFQAIQNELTANQNQLVMETSQKYETLINLQEDKSQTEVRQYQQKIEDLLSTLQQLQNEYSSLKQQTDGIAQGNMELQQQLSQQNYELQLNKNAHFALSQLNNFCQNFQLRDYNQNLKHIAARTQQISASTQNIKNNLQLIKGYSQLHRMQCSANGIQQAPELSRNSLLQSINKSVSPIKRDYRELARTQQAFRENEEPVLLRSVVLQERKMGELEESMRAARMTASRSSKK